MAVCFYSSKISDIACYSYIFLFDPSFFPPKNRITLTLPVINRSFAVFFLVSGAEKRKVVSLILEDPERARESYPAAMVHPKERLVWYLSEDAYG